VVLQANIFGVGGGVLSFDFGRARTKYKHSEKFLKCMWRALYISEVNTTPRKGKGFYVWLVSVG
jgi:hypothetical protein